MNPIPPAGMFEHLTEDQMEKLGNFLLSQSFQYMLPDGDVQVTENVLPIQQIGKKAMQWLGGLSSAETRALGKAWRGDGRMTSSELAHSPALNRLFRAPVSVRNEFLRRINGVSPPAEVKGPLDPKLKEAYGFLKSQKEYKDILDPFEDMQGYLDPKNKSKYDPTYKVRYVMEKNKIVAVSVTWAFMQGKTKVHVIDYHTPSMLGPDYVDSNFFSPLPKSMGANDIAMVEVSRGKGLEYYYQTGFKDDPSPYWHLATGKKERSTLLFYSPVPKTINRHDLLTNYVDAVDPDKKDQEMRDCLSRNKSFSSSSLQLVGSTDGGGRARRSHFQKSH